MKPRTDAVGTGVFISNPGAIAMTPIGDRPSSSSRYGYQSSSSFLEAFFDITYNLAAWEVGERRLGKQGAEVELFDNSRDRFEYCQGLAEEFDKTHQWLFGRGYYPTPDTLKRLYEENSDSPGAVWKVPDELGDDYVLAIDGFCDRKFKERTNK